MESGIYRILNTVNGMIYVGQAFVFQKRWKDHRVMLNLNKHSNGYLQSAWSKYGAHKFEFAVLEYCAIEYLTEREQFWMDTFKSADRTRGYNLAPAAGGCIGVKHSDETKAMWSEMRKGKLVHTEEAKAKIGEALKGRVFSEATLKKMSESHKGKEFSEETKRKMSESKIGNNFNTGRKQSTEEIEKRRNSNTGQKRSDEAKAKMSKAQTGRTFSLETRMRMSEAARNRRS